MNAWRDLLRDNEAGRGTPRAEGWAHAEHLAPWAPVVIWCAASNLFAGGFANRWPAKKAYADPSITKAMEAVRAAVARCRNHPLRPMYHFRPPARWMNDTCGAIRHKGYYHVFYQLNPTGDTWGADNTHWGHTRSKDLVHWEHLPVAICPSRERGERRCNSGCVTRNGKGKPVIFYTYVPLKKPFREQWIAVGDDDLLTWHKHPGNPVIDVANKTFPPEVLTRERGFSPGWSDPFVFRHAGRTFVTFKSSGGLVCEALNEDLTAWRYAGNFKGVGGECPNIFPLGGKWVLLTSGGFGSHQTQYQIGRIDFDRFEFTCEKRGILDHSYGKRRPSASGRGFYATNAMFDRRGRCILVAWVSGFPPNLGWNGCMSLPRVFTLGPDGLPRQRPAPELKELRGRHVRREKITLDNRAEVLDNAGGDMLEIAVRIDPGTAKSCGIKVRRSKDGSRAVAITCDGKTLHVAGTPVPLELPADRKGLSLRIFLDKAVLEVFAADGREAVTRCINDPKPDELGIELFAEGGRATLRSFDVWQMSPIWPE